MINYLSNGKGYNNYFNSRVDKKKILLYKLSCFPEPNTHRENKIAVELALANYATKSDLKNAAGIDTSQFAK